MYADISSGALRRLVDASPIPLTLASPVFEDCPLVHVNEAFLELSGYGRDEVIGRNCRFLQGPGSDPQARRRMREAIEGRRAVGVSIVNYRKSGERYHAFVFLHPILNSAGQISFFLGSQYEASALKPRLTPGEHARTLDDRIADGAAEIARADGLVVARKAATAVLLDSIARADCGT